MDHTQVPAAAPPPGVMPDFNNPDNYKQPNIILHSVVLSFTTLAVAVRLYARVVVRKRFGVDDWFALLSWALAVEFSVFSAYATVWGFGMHIYDIPATEILQTLKWLAVAQKSYFPLILSVKLCILLGYLRIFNVDRVMKWATWVGIIASTTFYAVAFFLELFRCKPIDAEWDPAVTGTCLSYAAFPTVTGVFNVISDFYILLLPLRPILKMEMPFGRCLRVASVFGLGLFACIAGILRFVVSVQYAADPDQTYVTAKTLYWTVLEINLGIICPCITAATAFSDTTAPASPGSPDGRSLTKSTGSSSQSSVASQTTSSESSEGSYPASSSDEGGQIRDESRELAWLEANLSLTTGLPARYDSSEESCSTSSSDEEARTRDEANELDWAQASLSRYPSSSSDEGGRIRDDEANELAWAEARWSWARALSMAT